MRRALYLPPVARRNRYQNQPDQDLLQANVHI